MQLISVFRCAILCTSTLFCISTKSIPSASQSSVPTRADHQIVPKLRRIAGLQFKAAILSLDLTEGSLASAALRDGSVQIWNVDTGQIVHEISTAESGPRQGQFQKHVLICARFAPGGKILAVSHADIISIYEVNTWREVKSLKPPTESSELDHTSAEPDSAGYLRMVITDFSFTADGRNIVAAYCHVGCAPGWILYGIRSKSVGSDPIRLWDIENKKIIWEHPSTQPEVPERVVTSQNGEFFATVSYTLLGEKRTIRMYDLRTGQEMYALPQFSSNLPPANVLFTRDSTQFVTASRQSSKAQGKSQKDYCERMHLGIYQTATGNLISAINNRNGAPDIADLSPDDRWLAASTCMTVGFQLWDFRTQRAVELIHPSWGYFAVDFIRFAPDGRTLAIGNSHERLVATYRSEF